MAFTRAVSDDVSAWPFTNEAKQYLTQTQMKFIFNEWIFSLFCAVEDTGCTVYSLLNSASNPRTYLCENACDFEFWFLFQSGDFSVSMKAPDRIKHFRIKAMPSNRFGIGQRTFSSLDELVEHYQKLPIFTCDNGQKMYLLRPYPKQEHLRNGIQR